MAGERHELYGARGGTRGGYIGGARGTVGLEALSGGAGER